MNKIALTPSQSSRIAAHGYNAETQTLALQFRTKKGLGGTYHYAGFPQALYDEFCGCESLGRFFGDRINVKDGDGNLVYPFTKIEP